MISIKSFRALALASTAFLALAGCGSSKNDAPQRASSTGTMGATDTTLTAGSVSVTIPAGALAQGTAITIREAEPRHAGAIARVEIEPHGQPLSAPARVALRFDDSSARVRMKDDTGALASVEVEDRNHGGYKTSMSSLGEMEVELEHDTCTPACAAGFECEHEDSGNLCKPHSEHPEARACAQVCPTGQECDDGACKLHTQVEPHDTGTTCIPACATGLTCRDGVCNHP